MRNALRPNADYRYPGGRVNKRRTGPDGKHFASTGRGDTTLHLYVLWPPSTGTFSQRSCSRSGRVGDVSGTTTPRFAFDNALYIVTLGGFTNR